MSEIAELEQALKSIKKQLKGARKQEEEAGKALTKLIKVKSKKKEDISEIFSAYDGWTEQEWQDHRAVNEKIGLAGSEHSRLGARVDRLKAERKQIKRKLKKAKAAEEKAREAEEAQAAVEAAIGDDADEVTVDWVVAADLEVLPDDGPDPAIEQAETETDGADGPVEDSPIVSADPFEPDEPDAPEPVDAAPTEPTVCGVCRTYPGTDSDLCELCTLLAGLDGPTAGITDPAVVAHGLTVAARATTSFEPGSAAEAAVRVGRSIHGIHVVLVDQIAGVTAGKDADPHVVNAAFADNLGGLAGSWAMPGIAAGLLESARAFHIDMSAQDFGDVLDTVLPDWLRNLWPSHEFSPLRHSLTVESADDQNNMHSRCVRCGVEGRGSLFYFEHDGGICGSGECQVCGLSGQFHVIAGRLFGIR